MKTNVAFVLVLMACSSAFAWVDSFNYVDQAAMNANWTNVSGKQAPALVLGAGDGAVGRVNSWNGMEGSMVGLQTGPSADWYINVASPSILGNYQGFGIFNADGSKHIEFFFDQSAPQPVRIDINTGTWQLYYWQTWFGSGSPSSSVTGLAGVWHFHTDAATGTTIYKDGQTVFTSGSYAFLDDPAMHFEFQVNYGGTPVDINWVGTEMVPEPVTLSFLGVGLIIGLLKRNRK